MHDVFYGHPYIATPTTTKPTTTTTKPVTTTTKPTTTTTKPTTTTKKKLQLQQNQQLLPPKLQQPPQVILTLIVTKIKSSKTGKFEV